MSRLTHLSLTNRIVVALLALGVAVGGFFAAANLRQENFPSLSTPGAFVSATYTGASVDVVEREITIPLERTLKAVKGVESVSSSTGEGLASIDVRWDYGKGSEETLSAVKQAFDNVKGSIPRNATAEIFVGSASDLPSMQIAVTGDSDETKLSAQASSFVLPALEAIPGVSKVEINGKNEQILRIDTRESDMLSKKVSISAIEAALSAANTVTSAGTTTTAAGALSVEVGRAPGTLEELRALPLQTESGPVPLADVATVELTQVERTSVSRLNGQPVLQISVSKTRDANAVSISHAVKAAIPAMEKQLGEGGSVTIQSDEAPAIEKSIHDLTVEGGLGLVFAVLAILVFLFSVRSTLIAAVSIPLSLFIALIGVYQANMTLNIFTLAALTIAVGRVVDDSIVVIENIRRRQNSSILTVESVVASVREVAGAITASTLTTIAVFLPIAFVGGPTGELFRPFSLTITIALLGSLVVALTIVPVLAFWWLPHREKQKVETYADPDDESHETVTRLQRMYLPTLRAALLHPVIALSVSVLILAGTLATVPLLKTSFLDEESDATTILLTQPVSPGTTLDAAVQRAGELEKVLDTLPQVTSYLTTTSPEATNFVIKIGPGKTKEAFTEVIYKKGGDLLTGPSGAATQSGSDAGLSSNRVSVSVSGEDAAGVKIGVEKVKEALTPLPDLTNITDDQKGDRPFLKVSIDRAVAAREGFTQIDVANAIQAALRGVSLGKVTLDGASYDITLRNYTGETSPEAIGNLLLPISSAQQAAASKAAADKLKEKSDAETKAKDENVSRESIKAREDLDRSKRELLKRLPELRAQRDSLVASPVSPVPEGSTASDDIANELAIERYQEELAAAENALTSAESSISDIESQIAASVKADQEVAAQKIEAEKAAKEQEEANNATATPIKVSAVAALTEEYAPSSTSREDGKRVGTVSAASASDDLGATTKAVTKALAKLDLPAGVAVKIGGASEQQAESFADLGTAMLIAIAMVFFIVVATFRSIIQALILLISIPFAATGAIAALLVTGIPLGIPALVGALMLIGIVVTNAIVLIDLINNYRRRGQPLAQAIETGARLRLRPILMTAVATIGALLPMAAGLTGGGTFISQSLAIVVIGGLTSSTILTLVIVPVLVSLVGKMKTDRRMTVESQ